MGFAKFSQTSWSEIFWKIFFAEKVQTRRSRAIIISNHRELRGENYAIASWTWERGKNLRNLLHLSNERFRMKSYNNMETGYVNEGEFSNRFFSRSRIYFYWKLNKKKISTLNTEKCCEHVSSKIEKNCFHFNGSKVELINYFNRLLLSERKRSVRSDNESKQSSHWRSRSRRKHPRN